MGDLVIAVDSSDDGAESNNESVNDGETADADQDAETLRRNQEYWRNFDPKCFLDIGIEDADKLTAPTTEMQTHGLRMFPHNYGALPAKKLEFVAESLKLLHEGNTYFQPDVRYRLLMGIKKEEEGDVDANKNVKKEVDSERGEQDGEDDDATDEPPKKKLRGRMKRRGAAGKRRGRAKKL